MAESWESCFQFAYYYTFFSFLPPFLRPSYRKFGYFTAFCSATCVIRVILIMPFENKTDYEIFFSVIKVGQTFFNTILFLHRRREFSQYEGRIRNFLTEEKTNPVFPEGKQFVQMWNESKPLTFTKYLFYSVTLPGIGWLVNAWFKLILNPESVTHSPTLFYAPGFSCSLAHKWFFTVFDTILTFTLMTQIIQADVAIIALLSFSRCQFSYSKYLLEAIFDENYKKRNDKTNKLWIKNHLQVFSLWNDLSHLLKPHITVNYLSQVGVIVFNVLALMEDNTNMNFMQKVMVSAVLFPLLFVLGYQCGLVEEINEIHGSMYQSLLKIETIQGGKKEIFFLKMLILRCQRPIIISGYGLFYLSRRDFKELVLNIYKFYSSLVSVKGKHPKKIMP